MTDEPECLYCYCRMLTDDFELLCVNKKSPCWGKIVDPRHKCKLFISRFDLTRTTRSFVEEFIDIENAFKILRASRHICNEAQ